MPKIDIDIFDDAPKVGDKVKVMGEVKSIDEDSGEVEVTYDDVSIVDKKRKKRRDRRDYDTDEEIILEQETMPNTQSLDEALGQAFPQTQ